MEIKLYGNPVLRKKSKKAEINKDNIELAKKMIDFMYESKGVGLAAPQIGINIRLVVIDLYDNTGPKILFNPEIIWKSEEITLFEEGCLSFPGIELEFERPARIKYRYYDEKGNCIEKDAKDLEARAIQHEIDHLDGKLIIDYVSTTKLTIIEKKLKEIRKKGKKQK